MRPSGFALGVLGSIGAAAALTVPLAKKDITFDALHMYLPMAHRVLEQGWAYMRTPESLAYAPMAFLFPALLGADATVVRWANLALFCATIAMAAWAVREQHSRAAGIAAALLVALSPAIRPWIMNVFTEPPFLFLMAVWIVAVVHAVAERRPGIGPRPATGWGWIVLGGAALALAALTRPAVMYFPPMAMVVCLGLGPVLRRGGKTSTNLALLFLVATIGIGAWVARNAIEFGFPAIAAGAGNALFLGINPLVDGFDPAYYGLMFDEGAAIEGNAPLTIGADRLLTAISLVELRDTPLADLARIAVHKVFAFLFVTASDRYSAPVTLLRTWRIALAVLAAAAIWFRPRSPLVLTLAGLVAYMVAVHAPLLYTHRYSVGALDLPLSMLAAIGIVEIAASPARIGAAAIALVLGIGAGLLQLLYFGFASPHMDRVPHVVVWSRPEAESFELQPGAAMEIPVRDAPLFHPWDMTMVAMDYTLTPRDKSRGCESMVLRYRGDKEGYDPLAFRRVPIVADGRPHAIVVGAVPLQLNHEGVLRLEFDCAAGARLDLAGLTIAAPRRATHYRNLYLQSR